MRSLSDHSSRYVRRALGAALTCALVLASRAAVAVAAPQVVVETSDGRALRGELSQISPEAIELTTADGAVKVPSAQLLSLKPAEAAAAPAEKPSLQVELVDGSLLAATEFQSAAGKASIQLAGGVKIQLPTQAIRWVRFQAASPDDKLAPQWSQILGTKAAGDLLVVRKKGALDYLEGMLGDVTDETAHFELDKEPIPVKRAKIEGLVYYHAQAEDQADLSAVAQAVDLAGTQLAVKSLALVDDQLAVTTPAGLAVQWPLASLARLDFSSANTQYVSDLEPVEIKFTSYFGSKDELASLSDFYKPRRNAGFEKGPLKVDGKAYRKGLAVHARTTLSYRLPGKFLRLKGLAGIDDAVRDAGDVKVEIRGDGGKLLWEAAIRGSEAARPLDVDIAGIKRLEILVDFGGDFDAGDVLDLCELRVTK